MISIRKPYPGPAILLTKGKETTSSGGGQFHVGARCGARLLVEELRLDEKFEPMRRAHLAWVEVLLLRCRVAQAKGELHSAAGLYQDLLDAQAPDKLFSACVKAYLQAQGLPAP